MDWESCITAYLRPMHGAVCFRGTRMPVSVVLDHLAVDEPVAAMPGEYPTSRPEHIAAPIGYAASDTRTG